MNVHFSENNSGGSWWLDESQYNALAAAGWEVGDRSAKKKFNSLEEGEKEWEYLTGRNSNEGGCECCGRPYQFWDEGE
jgi:hypothetical protein